MNKMMAKVGLTRYEKYGSIECGIQLEMERLKFKTQPLTVPCCTHKVILSPNEIRLDSKTKFRCIQYS